MELAILLAGLPGVSIPERNHPTTVTTPLTAPLGDVPHGGTDHLRVAHLYQYHQPPTRTAL